MLVTATGALSGNAVLPGTKRSGRFALCHAPSDLRENAGRVRIAIFAKLRANEIIRYLRSWL